jgi:hypothetical protein
MARQNELPGVDSRKIPEIHEAALEYQALKEERMDKGRQEKKAKDELFDIMKRHKKTRYVCNGVEVNLETEETVTIKVKNGKPEDDDEESI